MTSIFQQLAMLIPPLHGWATVEKGITLACYVAALKPAIVCEIGVWGGRSLFPMALVLKHLGSGKAIGVDPWNPDASKIGQVTEADEKWWSEQKNHEIAFQHFMYWREKLGLESIIEVQRLKSCDFDVPNGIGVLHVDGNHGPEAAEDVKHYGSRVMLGGVVVLDDLNWSGGHVAAGAAWLLANGFIELHKLGTGAVYLRMK